MLYYVIQMLMKCSFLMAIYLFISKVKDGMMSKLIHTLESTLVSSTFVQTNYELEYQSLTDAAYKYVGLFLSDADDDKLHDLAEEFTSNALKIGS